jgi:hypothetical protein
MIRLIPAIIIMLYYWLFRIKSYGKLLIFSTRGSQQIIVPKLRRWPEKVGSTLNYYNRRQRMIYLARDLKNY